MIISEAHVSVPFLLWTNQLRRIVVNVLFSEGRGAFGRVNATGSHEGLGRVRGIFPLRVTTNSKQREVGVGCVAIFWNRNVSRESVLGVHLGCGVSGHCSRTHLVAKRVIPIHILGGVIQSEIVCAGS